MTVKELRKHLGLSQSGFAGYFGIPVGTIHNWEQGVSNPPPYVVAMMERIITLEEALEAENNPKN